MRSEGPMPRPCLHCDAVGRWPIRKGPVLCGPCYRASQWARNARRAHYRGDYWAQRAVAIRKAGKRCQQCGNGGKLEVHHVIKRDPRSPLQVLCTACHHAHHDDPPGPKVQKEGASLPPASRSFTQIDRSAFISKLDDPA